MTLSDIKSQLLARIQEATANPKPNYSIDGQWINWQSYMDSLWLQLEKVNEQINASTPFEAINRGTS